MEKTLDNQNVAQAKENTSDLKVFGNGDLWQLISKASSDQERWMKSTKAMDVKHGCIIQVTTQQNGQIAEAITYVPGVCIHVDNNNNKYIG